MTSCLLRCLSLFHSKKKTDFFSAAAVNGTLTFYFMKIIIYVAFV